jgi:ubiquinone/menaquinone biosynthesis C-methylase UbiE
MATAYDDIAGQYQNAKRQPWRMHIEHHTLFGLLGDLRGLSVLDLACGEGFFTRFLKQAGAARVVGVDLSEGMIALAREQEAQRPLGVEYLVHDAKSLRLAEKFDLVVAAYLLNYAQTRGELLAMCRTCARHLRPGCRFVTVNNNPSQDPAYFGATAKYGLTKSGPDAPREGDPITYTFYLDEGSLEITNYHLSRETHEGALWEAGFREVRWLAPRVSPAGVAQFGREYWTDFLAHPPIIFLECRL